MVEVFSPTFLRSMHRNSDPCGKFYVQIYSSFCNCCGRDQLLVLSRWKLIWFSWFCRRTLWAISLCAWEQVISWKDDSPWTHNSFLSTNTRSWNWSSFLQCYGKVGCLTFIFSCCYHSNWPISNLLIIIGLQRFIDHIGELLQAYVDRREQVWCWCACTILAPKHLVYISICEREVRREALKFV